MQQSHIGGAQSAAATDPVMRRVWNKMDGLERLGTAYREDSSVRHRAENDPHALLREQGLDIPADIDVRIIANTPDQFHLILPPDPNMALVDEDLRIVAGGKSAGSAGTASTISSAATSLGSLGSASSAGSAS